MVFNSTTNIFLSRRAKPHWGLDIPVFFRKVSFSLLCGYLVIELVFSFIWGCPWCRFKREIEFLWSVIYRSWMEFLRVVSQAGNQEVEACPNFSFGIFRWSMESPPPLAYYLSQKSKYFPLYIIHFFFFVCVCIGICYMFCFVWFLRELPQEKSVSGEQFIVYGSRSGGNCAADESDFEVQIKIAIAVP